MQRWKSSREFKPEAVKSALERGVSAAQAARDLEVHASGPRTKSAKRKAIRVRPFAAMVAWDPSNMRLSGRAASGPG